MAPVDKIDLHASLQDSTTSSENDKTPRIRIRTYAPSDHAAAVAMFTAGMMSYASMPGQSYTFWDDYCRGSVNGDLARIEATYFEPGGHYWVAVVDREDNEEEVVGMVALQRKSETDGELRRMSVKAEYRRFGVGRMLVTNVEEWAAAHQYKRVFLAAGYVMERAIAFYTSLGYKIFADRLLLDDPEHVEACFEKLLA